MCALTRSYFHRADLVSCAMRLGPGIANILSLPFLSSNMLTSLHQSLPSEIYRLTMDFQKYTCWLIGLCAEVIAYWGTGFRAVTWNAVPDSCFLPSLGQTDTGVSPATRNVSSLPIIPRVHWSKDRLSSDLHDIARCRFPPSGNAPFIDTSWATKKF
jgi:hypothetical protein